MITMTRENESTAPIGSLLLAFELGQRSRKLGFRRSKLQVTSAVNSATPRFALANCERPGRWVTNQSGDMGNTL